MIIKNLFIIFIICLITKFTSHQNSQNQEVKTFKPPVIVNSLFPDTTRTILCDAQGVTEVYPFFAGRHKFQDTIDINPRIEREKNYYRDNTFHSYVRPEDTIDVNGFELVVDYATTIGYNRYYFDDKVLYAHYPVYFINNSNSDKLFIYKDRYAFGIQEVYKKFHWRPIEAKGFDFCGNGYHGFIIHPQEFVVVLMRKYKGDFKTQMRTRFKVGQTIYVSKPFYGIINPQQVNLRDSTSSQVLKFLEEDDVQAINRLFYGSIPQKEDWQKKF